MDLKWVPKGVTPDRFGSRFGVSGIQRKTTKFQLLGTNSASEASTIVFRRGGEKRFEKLEETSSHNECFWGVYNLENRAPV